MDYDLNREQLMMKEEFRHFLSKECDSEFVRNMIKDDTGYNQPIWSKMAKLGWTGLLIPESYGGSFRNFLDMIVLLGETGYACLPGPFFSTAVLGVICILEAGNDEQKESLLPGIAKGKRLMSLAWLESSGDFTAKGISLNAEQENGGYVLTGTKLFVPDAQIAHSVICVARTKEDQKNKEEGISLFVVDSKLSGIRIEPLDTYTGEKLYEVNFDQVRVSGECLLGALHQGWHVMRNIILKASVAKGAEMCGGARKVIELVVSYAKQRKQFGQPIGSFQAIQHHCANMLTFVDTSALMTYQTGWRIDAGLPFGKEAAMCKAWVSDSYGSLLALGHQIMGGIGFMEEYDLHLYYNRAKATELAFGDARYHRELVAEYMGL